MRKQEPIYTDLDLNMVAHPLTGDLVTKNNVDAVRQSLRNLFFLEAYDIPFSSTKQSSLRKMLFEPVNQLTESRIRTNLEWVIGKMEPRVKLDKLDVVASSDFTGYTITLLYHVKSIMQQDNYQFFVQRVR